MEESMLLWPADAPFAQGSAAIDIPTLTPFLPARGSGASMMVCPGGGYGWLAEDYEGRQVAKWLNLHGVAAFVLKYRLGPRYQHPVQLGDALRAIRTIRTRAAEWALDPKRIGICGFSAGGHLASCVCTHFDTGQPDAADPIERASSRPDFAALVYPVITMKPPLVNMDLRERLLGAEPDPAIVQWLSTDEQVTPDTPPAFLYHTADDDCVPAGNSLRYFQALCAAGVPAELHVFAHGQHGVGLTLNDPVLGVWTTLLSTWLRHTVKAVE
jgi:acetyl esterase/lipase